MIEIPITKGYTALVSDEDADLAGYKWWANIKKKNSPTVYVARNPIGMNGKMVQMHRVIMACVMGCDLLKSEFVDHINNIRTDNRRENLRIANNAQNMSNRGPQRNNTSGFKGVTWATDCRKWVAQIANNGKHFYLGLHLTAEEAAKTHDRAAIQLHGEFAHLNFDRSNYD